MPNRPKIFISATTKDLKSCRHLVRDALLTLECFPVLQDHFPLSTGEVRTMLRQRITNCQAVVHLVGECYGYEPQERSPSEPRRSYTQMEYDIARELGKPLYTFVCAPDFPYDAHEPESAELRALQDAHRMALTGGDGIYVPLKDPPELSLRVRELQTRVDALANDLQRTRDWLGRGVVAAVVALLLVAGLIYTTELRRTADQQRNDKLLVELQNSVGRLGKDGALVRENEQLSSDQDKQNDPHEEAAQQLGVSKEELAKRLADEKTDLRALYDQISKVSATADTKTAEWRALKRDTLFKLGDSNYAAGSYEEAIKNYSQAIELDPNSADLYLRRAFAHVAIHKDEEAVKDCTEAIRLDPRNAWAHVKRAHALSNLNRNAEALADYNAAITLRPEDASLVYYRATLYEKEGKYDLIIDEVGKLIEDDTSNALYFYARAVAYLMKNRPGDALADMEQVFRLDKEHKAGLKPQCEYMYRGYAYQNLRQYDDALRNYDEAIRIAHDFTFALQRRAEVYSARNQPELALKDYDEVIRLEPNNKGARRARAELYRNGKQYDLAAADYVEAVKIDPRDTDALIALGDVQNYYLHDYPAAITSYDEAVRLGRQDAYIFLVRATAYASVQKYDAAVKDCDAALRIDPKSASAYRTRGDIHRSQKKYDLAVADYDAASRLAPRDVSVFNGRGTAYLGLNKLGKAIEDFTASLQINPQDTYALISRGNAQGASKKFKEAIADYSEAIRLNPQDPLVLRNRAAAYRNSNQPQEADADEAKANQLAKR